MLKEECCENCVHYPTEFECLVKQPEEVAIAEYSCDFWGKEIPLPVVAEEEVLILDPPPMMPLEEGSL